MKKLIAVIIAIFSCAVEFTPATSLGQSPLEKKISSIVSATVPAGKIKKMSAHKFTDDSFELRLDVYDSIKNFPRINTMQQLESNSGVTYYVWHSISFSCSHSEHTWKITPKFYQLWYGARDTNQQVGIDSYVIRVWDGDAWLENGLWSKSDYPWIGNDVSLGAKKGLTTEEAINKFAPPGAKTIVMNIKKVLLQLQ